MELVAFCRAGRIYEIERWIMGGKPLHAATHADALRNVLDWSLPYQLIALLAREGFGFPWHLRP